MTIIEDSKGKTKKLQIATERQIQYRPTTLKITFNKQRTRRVISEEKKTMI